MASEFSIAIEPKPRVANWLVSAGLLRERFLLLEVNNNNSSLPALPGEL